MELVLVIPSEGSEGDISINIPTWQNGYYEDATPPELAIIEMQSVDVPASAQTVIIDPAWGPGGSIEVVVYTDGIRNTWNDLIRGRYPQGFSTWDSALVISPGLGE